MSDRYVALHAIYFLYAVETPGVRDSSRSWGRHDASGAAYGNLGRQQAAVVSGGDGRVAHPVEQVKHAVLVMLPRSSIPFRYALTSIKLYEHTAQVITRVLYRVMC